MHLPELLRMYHSIASDNKWISYWQRVLILITPFPLLYITILHNKYTMKNLTQFEHERMLISLRL